MREPEDTPRGLGDLIRFGTIDAVDLAAGTCVVKAGDIATGAVRWIETRAGATRTWSPPSVGEQVLLICAEGELAAGVALRGIFSTAFAPPGDSRRELIRFEDGALLAYNPETHFLEAILPAGGFVRIVAPEGVSIEGDVAIAGNLTVSGEAIAADDVKTGAISLRTHKHGDVQAGAAKTGAPE